MTEQAQAEKAAYAGDEERPLGSFLGLMGVYSGAVALASLSLRAAGRELPERVAPGDIALMSVATFRLSRLLTKDPVTSPLRAPFTTFEGTTGPAELKEEVRGTGPRKAIGELLTCPFCVGQWIATSFTVGFVAAPRATRLVTTVFSAVAAADVLQHVWAKLEQME